MNNYSNGSHVTWKCEEGKAVGKIIASYDFVVSRAINGQKVTRNGTPEDPAYLIVQEDGSEVLKLHSEISVI